MHENSYFAVVREHWEIYVLNDHMSVDGRLIIFLEFWIILNGFDPNMGSNAGFWQADSEKLHLYFSTSKNSVFQAGFDNYQVLEMVSYESKEVFFRRRLLKQCSTVVLIQGTGVVCRVDYPVPTACFLSTFF